jgi:hypothetical protein
MVDDRRGSRRGKQVDEIDFSLTGLSGIGYHHTTTEVGA